MSLFKTQAFSSAVIDTVISLISQSHFPIPFCHDFEEIDKIYLTFLQGSIGSSKAVYQGKVVRLIPVSIETDAQKIDLLLLISISRAIHHESIVAPIGWVASSNSNTEIILVYDVENSITWKDFCAKATLSWTDRAMAVKNLASAIQLCGVYNAHFRDIHWENVLVEDNLTVKILGQILMNEETEQALIESNKLTFYSLGALSLSCVSWGKISSSKEEILIFDPQFLLFQQQFIPLDCPEVLEAIAYACCDIDAPQLPTLPFITQQLTSMIPDIKSWELRLEKQQQAAIQSDAMGAARTAKRFSLLFNTDDFHQQLTYLQPSEDEHFVRDLDQLDTSSTTMSEEIHSPLHAKKLERKFSLKSREEIVQQRRASHRPVRTSMYIPRTTQSQQGLDGKKDDVPSSLVKLNEQLLNLEYDLAQSVQELENPFVREEYESYRPDALRRVMSSIQHCLKRITAHADSLQMATTGESIIEPQEILRLPVDQREDKLTHIPSFTHEVSNEKVSTETKDNVEFISPPETISPSMPSATARLFEVLSESDHDEREEDQRDVEEKKIATISVHEIENIEDVPDSNKDNLEMGCDEERKEYPLQHEPTSLEADEITAQTVNEVTENVPTINEEPLQQPIESPESDVAARLSSNNDDDNKAKGNLSNKIRKFTVLSEKEMLHPVVSVAVASGNDTSRTSSVSNKPVASAWSLASLTQSQPTVQSSSTLPSGAHGTVEMEEIVIISPIIKSEEVACVEVVSSQITVESAPQESDVLAEAKIDKEIFTLEMTITKESFSEPLPSMANKPTNSMQDVPEIVKEHRSLEIEHEIVPSCEKSSRSGSPRPVSVNAPFPPPPPPPKTSSSQSTSMASTPVPSLPSSRRPSLAVAQAHVVPPPPPPPQLPSSMPVGSTTSSRRPSTQLPEPLNNQQNRENETISDADGATSPTVTTELLASSSAISPPPPPPPRRPSLETIIQPSPEDTTIPSVPNDTSQIHSPLPPISPRTNEDDTNRSVKSHSPTPSFHNFSDHPPLLAAVVTPYPGQGLTMACFEAVDDSHRSDSPSVASVSTASYQSGTIFQGRPFASTKPTALPIPQVGNFPQQGNTHQPSPKLSPKTFPATRHDASLPPMASPLATATHFLDKIRHLDEMFSTLSGPEKHGSPDEDDKRRSPLPIHSLSPPMSKSPSQYSPTNASQNYAMYRQSHVHSSSQFNNNRNRNHFFHSQDEHEENEYDQTAHYSPQQSSSKPPLFQPEKQQQLQQTLQMYLSLVQRCSNTSARAKQVLDNLDQHMLSVQSVPSISPTQSSHRKNYHSSYNPYNSAVPSPFNPTAAAMQRAQQPSATFTGPSYMNPTSSSLSFTSHGGDALSPGRASRKSQQRTTLNRSLSSNSSMNASLAGSQPPTNYLGAQTIPKESAIQAKLQHMSSNVSSSASVGHSIGGVSSLASRSGSRSGSSQREGRKPPARSPVNKEVLSTHSNSRVYSISPSRRR